MAIRSTFARVCRLLGLARSGGQGARTERPSAVYVATLEGLEIQAATIRRLSPVGDFSQAALCASGRSLACWGRGPGESLHGVWIGDLDGGGARISPPDCLEGHPAWFPDERRVVCFSSGGHGEPEAWHPARQFAVDRSPRNLWSMRRDGSERRPLTSGPWIDERPCVAPDGVTLCFVSNRAGRLNLWQVRADGTALRRLSDGDLDYRPAVSPDGARLAWFTREPASGTHQLRIGSWPDASGQPLALQRPFRWIHGPQWLADSRRLLIHGLAAGDRDAALWLLDTGDGGATRLRVPGFAHAAHGSLDAAAQVLAFDSRVERR